MLTNHATERALGRIRAAGLEPGRVLEHARQVAGTLGAKPAAVRIAVLPRYVGSYGPESNGNEVWAIVRDARVVTLMLRRDNQSRQASALRVERVFLSKYLLE